MNDVTVSPGRASVLVAMAERFNTSPQALEACIRATCMKADRNGREPSREEFAAFLMVAQKYGLNPLTKEIYAFADRSGGIVPMVSVDGWMNIINSHPANDGVTFQDHRDSNGAVIAITCRIYRKDRAHPVEATEYLAECRRDTDPWRKWPRRMLRHKALIQAARLAFGYAGVYDPDEGERIAAELAKPIGTAPPPRTLTAKLDALEAPAEPGEAIAEEYVTVDGEILAEAPQDRAEAEAAPRPPQARETASPAPDMERWRRAGYRAAEQGMSARALPPELRDDGREAEAEAWRDGHRAWRDNPGDHG